MSDIMGRLEEIDRLRSELADSNAEIERLRAWGFKYLQECGVQARRADDALNQLVKKDDALREIDNTIAAFERVLLLPSAKEIKEIWRVARAALTDDHQSAPATPTLATLRQAIIDNTTGDLFWIGEILLVELEKETGFNGSAVTSAYQTKGD